MAIRAKVTEAAGRLLTPEERAGLVRQAESDAARWRGEGPPLAVSWHGRLRVVVDLDRGEVRIMTAAEYARCGYPAVRLGGI